MFPSMNPKKVQSMMKKLGIQQEEIDAERVIIEKSDGKIVIENPSVSKVVMQGQETFQISGEIKEEGESKEDTEKDIQTIMEKTNKSREEVANCLEKNNGDMASTILELSA